MNGNPADQVFTYFYLMNLTWHPADTVQNFSETQILEKEIGGKRIAFLRRGQTVYAFAAICPHGGARFCDGWTDYSGNIVCPLHKYKFNPANGYNCSGEGYKLKTYPVDIKDDMVFIGITE